MNTANAVLATAVAGLAEALEAAVARGESHKAGVAGYFRDLLHRLEATEEDELCRSIAREIALTGKLSELGLSEAESRAYNQAFDAAERFLAVGADSVVSQDKEQGK